MNEQRGRGKGEDERFCSECGDPVKRVAVVCVHCDAELRPTVGRQGARSGSSLEPEVAGALCYLFAWLTGIIFLMVEKDEQDDVVIIPLVWKRRESQAELFPEPRPEAVIGHETNQ